jgi:hypothetical protein
VLRQIVDESFIKEDVDVSLRGSCDEVQEIFASADDSGGVLWIREEESVLLAGDHGFGIVMKVGCGHKGMRSDLDLRARESSTVFDKCGNRKKTASDRQRAKCGVKQRYKAVGHSDVLRANTGVPRDRLSQISLLEVRIVGKD